jgi:prepilin-type N-terminal cleavage/methylation domain-containing protein
MQVFRGKFRIRSMENMIGKNQKGFTLIELLVAMSLSLIVLGAGYSVFRVQTHTVKAQESKMEAQEYARASLDMMVREVRNLGFFPTGTPCPGNTAGIVSPATATTLQIVYDANGDGDCADTVASGGEADENVAYAYNGTDITRAVNGGAAQPLTDGMVVSPTSFTYFDAAGNPITVPANIPTFARSVSITITVRARNTDAQVGGKPDITMNSKVVLRNRGNS